LPRRAPVVRLRIAGATLVARARGEAPGLRLPPRLRPFVPAAGDDIRLDLSADPVPEPDRSRLLFDSGGIWQVFADGAGLLYRFRAPRGEGPAARGVRIDRAWSKGTLFLPPSPYSRLAGFALSYPLDELLFAHHFAERGAMVVHGCGLVSGGRGLLFCGHSGAGKTTTARLWRRHRRDTRVLSDDRTVIRFRAGRPWIFGTPWHGSGRFARPEGAPLSAVFFLRQAARTRLTRLDTPAAAAQLYARSFPPPWSARGIARVLGACGRVARALPCHTLAFTPDASAVGVARAAVLQPERGSSIRDREGTWLRDPFF
jgi:hypothetical protein